MGELKNDDMVLCSKRYLEALEEENHKLTHELAMLVQDKNTLKEIDKAINYLYDRNVVTFEDIEKLLLGYKRLLYSTF